MRLLQRLVCGLALTTLLFADIDEHEHDMHSNRVIVKNQPEYVQDTQEIEDIDEGEHYIWVDALMMEQTQKRLRNYFSIVKKEENHRNNWRAKYNFPSMASASILSRQSVNILLYTLVIISSSPSYSD